MAWTYLNTALVEKPLVLAGPILRKTTKESVTVWLALQKRFKAILTVFDGNSIVMRGDADPVGVGANLHIVAVTATPVSGAGLSEGIVCQYDVSFDTGQSSIGFESATKNAQLGYGTLKRPSFSLPPADLNRLRILQGSCRMPHAQGLDTLPLIDELISTTAANAYGRPHQLLLTGDQIYADDVSQALLVMLMDASEVLLGWSEAIPGVVGGAKFAVPVPAGCGLLLRPMVKDPGITLREEEVPREGARVTRAYQLARWIDGTTHLWLGRRKAIGRGEGSSGLRFDTMESE
jgi:hypothetical protein